MKKFLHLILLFVGLFVVSGLFAQINTGGTAAVKFGKNSNYKNGIMPTNLPTGGTYGTSQAAADAYTAWKSTYTSTCGGGNRVFFGPDHSDQTVSEGIAYGMLLSVYAADKAMFDGLWTTYKANLDGNGLMNWTISGCSGAVASGGATDADVDVAMALIIAAEQWSSTAGNTYTADAKSMITKIKQYELGTDGSTLNGDTWGNTNTCRNPSYFSPAYYTEFAKVDANNATFWNTTAINATNTILTANRNSTSGLVSNWCDNSGTENSCGNTGSGASGYGADACRNPWRMAVDYLWHGASASTVAKDINAKLTTFVNGNEGQMKGPLTTRSVSNPSSGSYINGSYTTFALPPMTSTAAQASLNKCYSNVASLSNTDQYFNSTIRCISLFVLTGNFWAPGASGFVFPPTIAAAVTDTTGKIITLTSNKALNTSTPANTTFTVYFNGVAQTTSSVAVSGSTITVKIATAPAPGQTITISYTGTTILSTESSPLATFTGMTVLNMLSGNETILDDCDDGNSINNVGGIWFDFNDSPDQTKACTKGTTSSIVPLSSSKNPFNMTAPGYNGSAYAVNATYTLGKNYTPYASGTSGACASWTNPSYVGIGTWCNRVQAVTMDWRTGTGVSFWYKGPACSFQVVISEVTNFGFHQVAIKAATTWTKQTITWSQLLQPTWATTTPYTPVTFSAQHVQKLQWQIAVDADNAASSTGSIWIDDIHILNMPPVAMTSFTIGIDSLSKIKNPLTLTTTSTDTLKLQVMPTPTTASYPVASWKSSDTTVVKVDYNGNIKVIGYGTATITATGKMQQGLSATYTVTVPAPAVNPTSITFTPATYSIGIGSTTTLNPTFAPTGVNQTGLTWLSSNTAVATVNSSGVVTGVAAGSATITATSTAVTSVKGTATVTVTKVAVTGITITPTPLTVDVGNTATLTAVIAPANASVQKVTWTTNNSGVATVTTGGVVTGVSAGTCTITGKAADNTTILQAVPCTVVAPTILPTAVSVALSPTSIAIGATSTGTATFTPSDATDQTVTWASSNTAIATVNPTTGVITAVAIGTATITATSIAVPTVASSATITVTAIIPTAITVALSPTSIAVNATSTATPTFTPSNTSNKSVNWLSSNTAVATVSSGGIVTAVAAGTATITATSATTGTVSGSAIITVAATLPTALDVTLSPTAIAIAATSTATPTFTPSNTSDKSVKWLSSNTAVATVTSGGIVTAIAAGTATITATSVASGSISGSAVITVNATLPTAISVALSPTAINVGATSTASTTFTPTNPSDKTVTWSSSNNAIATVTSGGIVTAVSAGTATISATSNAVSTVKGSAVITVNPVLPTAISVDLAPTSISIGSTSAASATLTPLNTTVQTVTWSSSNTLIATVDPSTGVITGVAAGTASITATSDAVGTVKGSATITVTSILPISIAVTPASTNTLLVNGTVQLSAAITPSNATIQTVSWSSSNPLIATVNANTGLVTGVGIGGPVTITATSTSAPTVKGTASITVIKTAVTGITVTPTPLSIILGNSGTLTSVIAPTSATVQTVSWVSSDNTIATVSTGGIVTSVAVGTCTVTATSSDNTSISQIIPVSVTPVLPTSITVAPSSTPSLYVGGTVDLKATVNPTNTTVKTVTWTSSNPTVASVDAITGVVTGNKIGGPVTITATSDALGTVTGTATVTVVKTPVTGITITPATLGVVIGTPGNLSAVIAPASATIQTVTWTSSNNGIATVTTGGVVSGVTAGTCTITGTSLDNPSISQTVAVTVTSAIVLPTSLSLTPASSSIYVLGTTTLISTILPADASNMSVSWASSDPSIATVDANTGLITGKVLGSATITATSVSAPTVKNSATINVVKTPVTGIAITPTTLSVVTGTPETLTAIIAPSTATIQTVNWLSSNNGIATVSSGGVVSGIASGTCTITGTSADNSSVSQSILVTVTAAIILPNSITVTPTTNSIYVGKTVSLTATVSPAYVTDNSVSWSSSNTAIATVDASGIVTAIALGGPVTITAKSNASGTITGTATVTVIKTPVTSITVTPTTELIEVGKTATAIASILPVDATVQTVSWTTSNGSVAIVSTGGVISAISSGTATITVTSDDNTSLTKTITVNCVDKTALATAITNATTLNTNATEGVSTGMYPAGSKLILQNAINAATTVKTNVLATQAQVDAALATLNTAVTTFNNSVINVDKSILTSTITSSQSIYANAIEGSANGQYPTGSKATLQIAIDAASAVKTDALVSQSQVDQAILDLQNAVKAFQAKVIGINKGSLLTEIGNAQTLYTASTEGTGNGQYPNGSKATLQIAIDAASLVNSNTLASQTQVDQAVTALQAAEATFKAGKITIDKSALIAEITTSQALYTSSTEGIANGQYPTGSKAILQTAIDAASFVNTKATASQTEVTQAVADLKAAESAFKAKVIGVNKTDLVSAISAALTVYNSSSEGTGNGQYPTGSKATLIDAINTANTVNSDDLASQNQVDAAIATLNNAVATFQLLKISVSKTALVAEIGTAQGIYSTAVEGTLDGQYPTGSKAILQSAIDAASAINTSASSSQAQVDQAVIDLKAAEAAFKAKVIITNVDKSILAAAISTAQATYNGAKEGLTDGKYPVGSKVILQTAITAANSVNTNTTATQGQVDAAVVTLNNAVTAFKAKVIIIDKSKLTSAITAAQAVYDAALEGVGNGQYPTGSKDVLYAAILNANGPIDDAGSTQAQVDQAIIDLNDAVAAFKAQVIVVTKTALVAAISAAQAVYTPAIEGVADGQYPIGSKLTLQTAIDAASSINTNAGSSQAEVDQAVTDLNTAAGAFKAQKIVVDKSTLTASITSAQSTYSTAIEGTVEGQYPSGSKVILQAAIDASVIVKNNTLASQAQVDKSNTDLLAALAAFKAKVIPPAVISTLIFDAEKDNLTLFNTPWFSYDDSKAKPAPGGSSVVKPLSTDTIPFTMTAPGANSTAHAAMMDYSLMGRSVLGYDPFVGMGFGFTNPLSAYDLSGTTGISFWVKSNKDYFVEINLTSITDDCNYFKKLAATSSWTEVTLLWSDLFQYNWGIQKPWDLKLLNQIQWKIQDADGTAGQVWIDDVRILGKKLNLPVIADKSALVVKIASAQTLYTASIEGGAEGQYPTGSKAILQTAITAANTVNTTMTISQADVDQAVIDLQTAMTQFQAKAIHVNKALLVTAISNAQTTHDGAIEGSSNGQYPVGSKATLQIAINTATNVNTNNLSTQAQVDAAIVTLNNAATAFKAKIISVNKVALLALISTAQSTSSSAVVGTLDGQYPASAKTDLNAAILIAQTASTNASISQAQVDQAVTALQTAIDIFKGQVNTSLPID